MIFCISFLLSCLRFCFILFFVQPSFFIAVFAAQENDNVDVQPSNAGGVMLPGNEVSIRSADSEKLRLVDVVLRFVVNSDDIINRYILLKASIVWFICQFVVTV